MSFNNAPRSGDTTGDIVRTVAGGGAGAGVGGAFDALLHRIVDVSTEVDVAVGGGFALAGMAVALLWRRSETGE